MGFVVSSVPQAKAGLDYFEHPGLLVERRGRHITDPMTSKVAVGSPTRYYASGSFMPAAKKELNQTSSLANFINWLAPATTCC